MNEPETVQAAYEAGWDKQLRVVRDRVHWAAMQLENVPPPHRIVTISGSTRFIDLMAIAAWEFEKRGVIALGCHLLPHWYGAASDHQAEVEGVAEKLDVLHMEKIRASKAVFVVNVDKYLGASTRREIFYAQRSGKGVWFLE